MHLLFSNSCNWFLTVILLSQVRTPLEVQYYQGDEKFFPSSSPLHLQVICYIFFSCSFVRFCVFLVFEFLYCVFIFFSCSFICFCVFLVFEFLYCVFWTSMWYGAWSLNNSAWSLNNSEGDYFLWFVNFLSQILCNI